MISSLTFVLSAPLETTTAKCDLTFNILPRKDDVVFATEYCTDLYTAENIDRFTAMYCGLLESCLDDGKLIKDISVISDDEQQLLDSFNETADMIDVSDKSTDWRQYIYGQKGATADVTVFADDASQKALLDALRQGETVYCFSGELDATGKTPVRGRLFEALVGSIGDTFDMGAVASRSISLTVTGAPEFYPKAS